MIIFRSILFFLLAGLMEISGGYLVWQWFREGKALWLGLLGALLLVLYGIIPTFQPAHFGKVYAAYGGVFVILSLVWGMVFDHTIPDRWDLIGGAFCLIGVGLIMWMPRS